jgi:acyl-CoA oxidase
MQRLKLIKNHLSAQQQEVPESEDPKELLKHYRSLSTIDPQVLLDTVYGDFEKFRTECLTKLAQSGLPKPYTSSEGTRQEQRHISLHQMKKVIETCGPFSAEETMKNPTKMASVVCTLYGFDAGLATKLGVHFLLYAKSIMLLGSEKHKKVAESAYALEDIGCFALTELSHGSNVQGIRTRADYDHKTRQFVLNTPTKADMKIWIGASAHLANLSLVFAQLYIGEKNYGVHAFLVPIRNKSDHSLLPGVTVGDCGLKVGLNSLDNGFLMFKDVRIPYDNLMDRFSSIDQEGKFQSSVKSSNKRFAFLMGALGGGRLVVTKYSVIMLTNALTVATRFAACRRQFGPPGTVESNILEYPLTQYRLMPYLADLMAINCGNYKLYQVWAQHQDKMFAENDPLLTEVHALTSTLKPISSWLAQQGTQECREICGGLGYSAYNRLGAFREENDINTTWEGDNNVLMQQTAKFVLDCVRKMKTKGKEAIPYPSMYFLSEEAPVVAPVGPNEDSQFCKDGYDLKKAFELRVNTLIHRCADRLQKEFEDGKPPMEIWNGMQVYYMQNTAKAFTELYMLNEFKGRLTECGHEGTRKVFEKLYELYGYNKIEKDATLLFEIGYINQKDLAIVRERVVTLCRELKDEAIGIIDALAMPDELLNSAIGSTNGDIYNNFISALWAAPQTFDKPAYWKEIRLLAQKN